MALGSSFCLLLITCMILIGISPNSAADLSDTFYDKSCPKALRTIRKTVQDAVSNESRMGASILRLHFHDCFVQVNSFLILVYINLHLISCTHARA